MAAPQVNSKARGRLATNDNETIVVADEPDTEAHRLAANENETVVAAATNDNETTVKGARRLESDGEEQPTAPDAARR